MSSQLISNNSENKKIKISVPFWVIYIIIPVLILVPILYFILIAPPEEVTIPGLSIEEVDMIEKDMEILETSFFQSLSLVIPEEFSIPKEKIGRENPFAPVK